MAGTHCILLIDDDLALAEILQAAFTGYAVSHVESGQDALLMLDSFKPDLILLDLMLPDADGLVFLSHLREATHAPILVLSARTEQVDRVLSLKLGASDFVAKPFDLDDLEARVAGLIRQNTPRPAAANTDVLHIQDLVIELLKATVKLHDHVANLTPTEYRLLVALAEKPGQTLSRGELAVNLKSLVNAGAEIMDGDGHLVDVHISRLRVKLRIASPESAEVIISKRGQGYALDPARTI